MARPAYRSLYGDLTQLKDRTILNDPAAGSGAFDDALWSLLLAASQWVDGHCNRTFAPITETRYFDLATRLPELDPGDLVAVSTLKDDENQDGTFEHTWSVSDYHLQPHNAAPTQPWGRPFYRIRASQLSSGNKQEGFPRGDRAVEIAGRWGYAEHQEDSGSLINNGGGHSDSDTTINVDSGADFAVGQTIMVQPSSGDDEQMLITAISSNALTVVRGLNGTTPGSLPDDRTVNILRFPAPVERAALITAARLFTRAPAFEPAFVANDLDPDVKALLDQYRRL